LRLVAYAKSGSAHVGVEREDGIAPIHGYTSLLDLLDDSDTGLNRAREAARSAETVEPDRILAPYRPRVMLASGINFASHMEEEPGARFTDEPYLFSKLPRAVIGPGDAIVIPYPNLCADYEVELAVVIGRKAKDVPAERAAEYVFGYTLHHDVSARTIQFKESQLTLGKNLDTFAPLGPAIVTADEIPDYRKLRLRTMLNGDVVQDESAGNMRWGPEIMIAWISSMITLEPGDLISMGSPAGCGTFRNPQVFLKPGDVVTISASQIGDLTNPVVAGPYYDERSWEEVVAPTHLEI
jgi:2-keto-4-pentenoate hydratase/2-oxohepta-3-ene-1,7-dioic acid hydratase in catechol pathway